MRVSMGNAVGYVRVDHPGPLSRSKPAQGIATGTAAQAGRSINQSRSGHDAWVPQVMGGACVALVLILSIIGVALKFAAWWSVLGWLLLSFIGGILIMASTPRLLQVLLPERFGTQVPGSKVMQKTMCVPLGLFGFTWLCISFSPLLHNHNFVKCVLTIGVWYMFDHFSLRPMVMWIEEEEEEDMGHDRVRLQRVIHSMSKTLLVFPSLVGAELYFVSDNIFHRIMQRPVSVALAMLPTMIGVLYISYQNAVHDDAVREHLEEEKKRRERLAAEYQQLTAEHPELGHSISWLKTTKDMSAANSKAEVETAFHGQVRRVIRKADDVTTKDIQVVAACLVLFFLSMLGCLWILQRGYGAQLALPLFCGCCIMWVAKFERHSNTKVIATLAVSILLCLALVRPAPLRNCDLNVLFPTGHHSLTYQGFLRRKAACPDAQDLFIEANGTNITRDAVDCFGMYGGAKGSIPRCLQLSDETTFQQSVYNLKSDVVQDFVSLQKFWIDVLMQPQPSLEAALKLARQGHCNYTEVVDFANPILVATTVTTKMTAVWAVMNNPKFSSLQAFITPFTFAAVTYCSLNFWARFRYIAEILWFGYSACVSDESRRTTSWAIAVLDVLNPFAKLMFSHDILTMFLYLVLLVTIILTRIMPEKALKEIEDDVLQPLFFLFSQPKIMLNFVKSIVERIPETYDVRSMLLDSMNTSKLSTDREGTFYTRLPMYRELYLNGKEDLEQTWFAYPLKVLWWIALVPHRCGFGTTHNQLLATHYAQKLLDREGGDPSSRDGNPTTNGPGNAFTKKAGHVMQQYMLLWCYFCFYVPMTIVIGPALVPVAWLTLTSIMLPSTWLFVAVFVVLPQAFVKTIKVALDIADVSQDTSTQDVLSNVSVFLIVTCFMVPVLKTCLTLFDEIAATDFLSDPIGRALDIWWAANVRPWCDLASGSKALGHFKDTFSVSDVTAMVAV